MIPLSWLTLGRPGTAASRSGIDDPESTDGRSADRRSWLRRHRTRDVLALAPRLAIRGLVALGFAGVQVVMDAAIRVHFSRVTVVGAGRFRRRGPVLLVANHPAAWTDVVVLDVALGRKLHFVAHESLFRPWIRGLALRLYAALPLRFRREGAAGTEPNRGTYEHCHALFRRGEVVAFFPEGVSAGDRTLAPLKTGAARLALDYVARGGWHLALIPVALRYEDRAAFRSRLDVVVGRPIPVTPVSEDRDQAAHVLTQSIAHGIESALATPGLQSPTLYSRPMRRRLMWLERPMARLGVALHAIPVLAIEAVARRVGGQPQSTAFARILSGVVLLPLWYGSLAVLAWTLGGGAWLALPLSAPALGILVCREVDRRRELGAHP